MGYVGTIGPRPADLQPERFTPVGRGGSQTELQTIYDRPIPEMFYKFTRHLNYAGFSLWLKAMGFSEGHDQSVVGHYEDNWTEDTVTVNAIITGGGVGADIVLELHADDIFDTGVTVNSVGRKASYVQPGDVLEFFDREQGWVVSKDVTFDPHRITVRPLDATVDLSGSINAAESYGIAYNLWPEGDGLPTTRAPRVIKYQNEFGICKEAFGGTGSDATNTVYFETIAGDPDSARDIIYAQIKNESLKRFEMGRSNMLLFGQIPDNITKFVTNEGIDIPVKGTEGFVPFALTNGYQDGYTLGSYTTADFNVISNILYDERAAVTNGVICWQGPGISEEIEESFTQTLQQNLAPLVDRIVPGYMGYANTQYAEGLDYDATDATLSFGYSAIKKLGFIYHLQRLDEFHDIKRLGGASYPYRDYQIAVPIGQTQDLRSGSMRPTFGYHWREDKKRGYKRDVVMGTIAGAGVGGYNSPYGAPVNEWDSFTWFALSEIAGHFALGNSIVTQLPA